MDRIGFGELEQVEKIHFFDSKSDKNDLDTEVTYKFAPINKRIEYILGRVKKLCETCIESKFMRIVRSKKITIITRKL